ncbi:MAG: sugar transferase [Candidatus Hydrogenedentes bacterium]|nr:sugar transferase [Candidatus Hydrogenedentota bacterium]
MKFSIKTVIAWTGATTLLLLVTQTVLAQDAASSVVLPPALSSFMLFGTGIVAGLLSLAQKSYREVRPVLDYLLAVVLLIVTAPVMLVIAVAVKLSSEGPILFKQVRVGENRRSQNSWGEGFGKSPGCRRKINHHGRLFTIYKFRTMYIDAESSTGPVWSTSGDPRVTPVGRVLRATHLDELPQLFNVLRGEMSMVGPRPERPYFVQKLKNEVNGYLSRLEVKPGITGLAQVSHRADETLADVVRKIAYDRLYVARQSLLIDIKILLATVKVVLVGAPSPRRVRSTRGV